MDERKKYFQLLAEKYPTMRALSREIINLTAILNLPKGTEDHQSHRHSQPAQGHRALYERPSRRV